MSTMHQEHDTVELVVLAGLDGKPAGTCPKAYVHHKDTPLHFAFSCYLVHPVTGEILVTRRALTKKTWPGVWTNAMCGHPGPGEKPVEALRRRGTQELGITAEACVDVQCILPDFSYRAVDSSGIVENEICPVFVAHMAQGTDLDPVPEEVDSWAWVKLPDLVAATTATPFVFSPWMVGQLSHPALVDALSVFCQSNGLRH